MLIKKLITDESVLIISDLHLGDGTGSDDFTYSDFKKLRNAETSLIAWITDVNPTYLILNGDIEELWQHSILDVKRVHKALCKFFDERAAIRLYGNHDFRSLGPDRMVLELTSGQRVLVAHGHQGDAAMSNPFLKAAVFLLGLVEKIIPGIEKLNGLLNKEAATSSVILENAAKFAAKMLASYEFVVLGHTHKLSSSAGYFNSGTCQWNLHQGVYIKNAAIGLKGR